MFSHVHASAQASSSAVSYAVPLSHLRPLSCANAAKLELQRRVRPQNRSLGTRRDCALPRTKNSLHENGFDHFPMRKPEPAGPASKAGRTGARIRNRASAESRRRIRRRSPTCRWSHRDSCYMPHAAQKLPSPTNLHLCKKRCSLKRHRPCIPVQPTAIQLRPDIRALRD